MRHEALPERDLGTLVSEEHAGANPLGSAVMERRGILALVIPALIATAGVVRAQAPGTADGTHPRQMMLRTWPHATCTGAGPLGCLWT